MSRVDGYTHYVCDRNGKHEAYARDDDPEVNHWHIVSRIDQMGVERTYTLCSKCFEDYQSLAQAQDQGFTKFMSEGGE